LQPNKKYSFLRASENVQTEEVVTTTIVETAAVTSSAATATIDMIDAAAVVPVPPNAKLVWQLQVRKS
jgi:hypothetical protein